jgi:hypothetical protein
MELKTARLTLLIDPNKKAAFERLCAQQDRTASQVVRQLIRDYLAHHGVEYVASGATEGKSPATDQAPPSRKRLHTKRAAPPTAKRPTERRKD